MAKEVFYRQCRLVKRIIGGDELMMVSWLPEPYATAGRVVKLRQDGAWDDGWVVRSAGSNRLPADQVPDFHELSKAHLRASGDAETAKKK